MRPRRSSEGQLVGTLKQSEAGLATARSCHKHEVPEPTLYRWKARYGVGVASGDGQRHDPSRWTPNFHSAWMIL